MISFVVALISSIAAFIPSNVWYVIIVAGSILFGLTGNGWLTVIKTLLAFYAFWLFLWLVAWLFPTWLENVTVIIIALLFWDAYH